MEGPYTDIVFIDPPERVQKRGARYDWPEIVTALLEHPGEWALVLRQVPRSVAQALRKGKISAVRPPAYYEVITRNGKGQVADLYMKYIGPDFRNRNGDRE